MHLATVQLQTTQLLFKGKSANPIGELTNEECSCGPHFHTYHPRSYVISCVCSVRNKAIFFVLFLCFHSYFDSGSREAESKGLHDRPLLA